MINLTKKVLVSLSIVTAVAISANAASNEKTSKTEVSKSASILDAYSDIALANYSDALKDAKSLKTAIDAFAKSPTQANLDNAKKAWLTSRESYGQTEIFRLANGPIDAEDGWVADSYGALEGQ